MENCIVDKLSNQLALQIGNNMTIMVGAAVQHTEPKPLNLASD